MIQTVLNLAHLLLVIVYVLLDWNRNIESYELPKNKMIQSTCVMQV
jgi:hypothetical protein